MGDYHAYLNKDDDKILMDYAEELHKDGMITSNTRYAVCTYILKEIVKVLKRVKLSDDIKELYKILTEYGLPLDRNGELKEPKPTGASNKELNSENEIKTKE